MVFETIDIKNVFQVSRLCVYSRDLSRNVTKESTITHHASLIATLLIRSLKKACNSISLMHGTPIMSYIG